MHLSLSNTQGCGAPSGDLQCNLLICNAICSRPADGQKAGHKWPAQYGKVGARTGRQDAGRQVWTADAAATKQAPHDGSWCTAALTSATACTPSWSVCAPHTQRAQCRNDRARPSRAEAYM